MSSAKHQIPLLKNTEAYYSCTLWRKSVAYLLVCFAKIYIFIGKTARLENLYKRTQNGVRYHHNSVFLEVTFKFKLIIEGYLSTFYKLWLESILSIYQDHITGNHFSSWYPFIWPFLDEFHHSLNLIQMFDILLRF